MNTKQVQAAAKEMGLDWSLIVEVANELAQAEAAKRQDDVRQAAWRVLTGERACYAEFWRHGFASRFAARLESSDYTSIPAYDIIYDRVRREFPAWDYEGGEGGLFDFLLSNRPAMPTRAELLGQALDQLIARGEQVEDDSFTFGANDSEF